VNLSKSESPEWLIKTANQALKSKEFASAIKLYQQALILSPQQPMLWANLIHVLWVADQAEQGLATFAQARAQLPDQLLPWRNCSNIQRDLNAFEAAEEACRRAMALEDINQQAETAWNLSQLLIGLERYPEAYALAEHRFQIRRHQVWRPGPYWQGWPAAPAGNTEKSELINSLMGHAVCVWSEQGLGDTLQYLRWLAPLIRRGAQVRLELEPSLVGLVREGMAWLGAGLTVAPKGCSPLPLESPCHGSLLSLPMLLGGAPLPDETSPPYLRSPLWPTAAVMALNRPPLVGVVWASGRKSEDDFVIREYHRRSLPPAPLKAMLQGLSAAGAQLVNLQFGPDVARAEGWDGAFKACLPPSASFAESARWMASLDLVITVDTASAHQIGAMGIPGWLLLPWNADPRWLRDRSDSPWYPSLSLLRQCSPGDWWGLVEQVLTRFNRWQGLRRCT
jgi:tetratricopeptide (TPR) repeat protein